VVFKRPRWAQIPTRKDEGAASTNASVTA